MKAAFSCLILTKNESRRTFYTVKPPAVHGVQFFSLSYRTLEKYYLCCLPLPFMPTILGKVSNGTGNSNERKPANNQKPFSMLTATAETPATTSSILF